MLKFYSGYPFVPTNEITQIDAYIGDGINNTFTLVFKTAPYVANVSQIDSTLKYRSLNGVTFPSNTQIAFNSVPPAQSQIIVPGTNPVLFTLFDTAVEPGVPSPANQDAFNFWLADDGTGVNNNILVNTYMPVNGNPGIAIFFQNMVTAAGAQTFWTQLACCDASGNALSYQATGTTLYTDGYYAVTSLSATAGPGSPGPSTTITVNSASGFYPGDYVFLNPGGGTAEKFLITAINYGTGVMTTSGLNYTHYANESLFMIGRQFSALGTLPLGSLAGIPNIYINLSLTYDLYAVARQ